MEKESIKLIRSLSERKQRNEHKLFVVEGVKLCEEIAKSGLKIEKFFFTDKLSFEALKPFLDIKPENISPTEMGRISNLKSPTAALAVVKMEQSRSRKIDSDKLTLILDSIQDPGNLGTIIRICDWFGIRDIFCSLDTVDLYNQKVIQSTMGAISRVNVTYCEIEELLIDAKNRGVEIFSTDLDGENIYSETLPPTGVIIMGNEGKGVSQKIKKLASKRLLIPSFPEKNACESLNVAVATAICCAEFRRQHI